MHIEFLQRSYLGLTISDWVTAAGIVGIGLPILLFARSFIVSRLAKTAERTATIVDDIGIEIVRRTRTWFLIVVLLSIAARVLSLPPRADATIHLLMVIATFFQGGVWANAALAVWRRGYVTKHAALDDGSAATFSVIDLFARIVIWTLLFLMAAENLNFRITTLVAGLGITGIAVALAVQSALGDVLAAFFIVLDRPFVVGDLIAVDSYKGTVERVGLRSTRIRSTTGETIVMANGDITRSRLRNYRRLMERRVNLDIGIAPATPASQLTGVLAAMRSIVEAQDGLRVDSAHFKRKTADAIEFELIYHVSSAAQLDYMDAQQAIGLSVAQRLEGEGIALVYIEPTPAP
ncbi:MAG: mechanosensitive ion channel family protein [Gemmatimonadota bacterium]|nr:mechanosensitive ion channel family protein [Gemmatimonadota bacterium]